MVTAILIVVGVAITVVSGYRWVKAVATATATEVATDVATDIVNEKLKDQ